EADLLTIDAGHRSRVFTVAPGATALISGLTIARGSARFGGGIHNAGTLMVSNSILSANLAVYGGGGVYNAGTLTISGSTLSGNTTELETSDTQGGGIYNAGTLTASNSTLSANGAEDEGGGIYNTGALTVSDSTLSGNYVVRGGGLGGGIDNYG